jgi:hypothetical protein
MSMRGSQCATLAPSVAALCLLLLFAVASALLHPKRIATNTSPNDRTSTRNSNAVSHTRLQTYPALPLAFEANRGQADPQVDFISHSRGYSFAISPTEIGLSRVLQQPAKQLPKTSASSPVSTPVAISQTDSRFNSLRMRFVHANPHPAKDAIEELPSKVNYFIGNDPARWMHNVPTYAKIRYHDVYPGVDITYYGNPSQLEYDFAIAAGADPKTILLDFEGVDHLDLDVHGDLLLRSNGQQSLQLHKPFIYQEMNGARQEVAGNYVLRNHLVGFEISGYDSSKPLVVDPVFVYSTLLSGGGDEAGWAIATDRDGNVYVTGDTNSDRFPLSKKSLQRTYGGSTDVFVSKLSADGSKLLYSTYLGGSGAEVGYGIALDPEGNIYVTGDSSSTDFPVVKPLQPTLKGAPDIFVAKLSTDGSALLYSTYIGGSNGDRGNGIAVDSSGNACVTGYTHSKDFPTANPIQAAFGGGNAGAFVLKLNPTGSALLYSTYLGGGNDRPDIGTAIAVDSAGNAYVTGFTNSRDFPTVKPLQPFVGPTDVFVAKLNATGSALLYSTHLGGSADDEAMGIAIDAAGSAYVTGETESPNFPTTPGAFSRTCVSVPAHSAIGDICSGGDAFISKLSPDGSALIYSTYLNGSGFEVGRSIAVGKDGSVYVTGFTGSRDFPRYDPLQKAFGGGEFDAFVVKLNPSGSTLTYSTYLGGSGDEGAYGITLDPNDDAYVTGFTSSADFPTHRPLRNGSREPSSDFRAIFISKISSTAGSP